MTDNLRLLLDPVPFQYPARFQAVIIPAEWMAMERQVQATTPLCLPDMREFVDEEPLPRWRGLGKIVTIGAACGVKVDVPARRHGHLTRLKREELASPDRDGSEIHRRSEH